VVAKLPSLGSQKKYNSKESSMVKKEMKRAAKIKNYFKHIKK
jgi:hypothetical protein